MADDIERAHVLLGKFQADTLQDLGASLRMLGDQIMREGIGEGVSILGGSSAGHVLRYSTNPAQTHDRYFEAIEESLRPTQGEDQ